MRRQLGARAGRLQRGESLGSTEAVKRAVMAGLGVSLVMAAAVQREIQDGTLVGLRLAGPPLVKTLYLIATRGRGSTMALFHDLLAQAREGASR